MVDDNLKAYWLDADHTPAPNVYDIYPAAYYNLGSDYFSDYDQATEYWITIGVDCGLSDYDVSCWQDGNRWSVVYGFGGVVMVMLALNSAVMIAGAWNHHARGLSLACGGLCSCLNLAAIITIGVFRFNTWGLFSALCTGGSHYDSSKSSGLSDSHTYSGDAGLIIVLWLC